MSPAASVPHSSFHPVNQHPSKPTTLQPLLNPNPNPKPTRNTPQTNPELTLNQPTKPKPTPNHPPTTQPPHHPTPPPQVGRGSTAWSTYIYIYQSMFLSTCSSMQQVSVQLFASICLRPFVIVHCWFKREPLTAGHIFYFSKGRNSKWKFVIWLWVKTNGIPL